MKHKVSPVELTAREEDILRIVQGDIPRTATPFADIASQVGCTEEEVISLLQRLKDAGVIRRFGASLSHQKTEWTHNVMVGWKVADDVIDEAGARAAEHPNVSHCYHRPSPLSDFPYSLYTMIHGRSDDECDRAIAELGRIPGMEDCVRLVTEQELKKCSPTYF